MGKQQKRTPDKEGLVWQGSNFSQIATVLLLMRWSRPWGLVFFVFTLQCWTVGLGNREGEVNFYLPLKKERAKKETHCQGFKTTKVSLKASLGPKCEIDKVCHWPYFCAIATLNVALSTSGRPWTLDCHPPYWNEPLEKEVIGSQWTFSGGLEYRIIPSSSTPDLPNYLHTSPFDPNYDNQRCSLCNRVICLVTNL